MTYNGHKGWLSPLGGGGIFSAENIPAANMGLKFQGCGIILEKANINMIIPGK